MMYMLDLQVRITLIDQLTVSEGTSLGSHVSHLDKAGFQSGEILRGGLRPGMLILGQEHGSLIAYNRNDRAIEASFPDRAAGTLLTLEGECIQCVTTNALQGGNGIGAQALMRLRMALLQSLVPGSQTGRPEASRGHLLAHGLDMRHHLRAA